METTHQITIREQGQVDGPPQALTGSQGAAGQVDTGLSLCCSQAA